ncbi:MAG TPA: UDP-N-acetylmuramoyl-tripeptide--D-alanyl-D-alanine ligase [Solirubrobacteraceae bacterium]|nr:UDP-N-acetylmuramoyl-tripeptide--D-alanyl-D-alanine ligase [Solirubrobacteraceae bacterium]
MRDWDALRVARAAGAELVAGPEAANPVGPSGVAIDSRALAPGELFVGLRGEHADGGAFAAQALAAGAWGVLVAPEHARAVAAAVRAGAISDASTPERGSVVLAHEDPIAALHALARTRRVELRERGAKVVAITGSTGKTSTKDILAALLSSHVRVAASPENFNTEIGLPLALLGAPGDADVLVLEMAMRGPGQIAQLTEIAQPDVGVIVNVGPAHLELLGSLEAIAAAKAELIAGLGSDASVVVPAGEQLLADHLREHGSKPSITFGEGAVGADVTLVERRADGWVAIVHDGEQIELRPSFAQAHHLRNLLAAVAAARALGYTPSGRLEVRFSAMRGQRERLASGVLLIDDCYNANPMSMHAAIDDLAQTPAERRVAVLGDMLELGLQGPRLHREIGAHADARGVELLVTVGPLATEMGHGFSGETHAVADARAAAELVGGLLRDGDAVLVKGSRGVCLEQVVERLRGDASVLVSAGANASGRR